MKTIRSLFSITLLVLLIISSAARAAEDQPAWYQPNVVRASLEIGLTPEQQPLFREAVARFITDLGVEVRQLMQRNTRNLDRAIRSKTRRLSKRMDTEMAEFLTPEQMPRYEAYRDELLREMRN